MSDIDELKNLTIKELVDFFKGPKAVRDSKRAIFGVNAAIKSLAVVGRLKATERAKDATQLMVIRNVAESKKDFKEYVKASMPHLNPSKGS